MIETVIQYTKATEFVGAWIEYKQTKRAGLSMRRLCELLELKSPSYLKLVLDGKRGLTSDLGEKLSSLMGLNQDQREYFFALIEHESASDEKDRERAERALLRSRRRLRTEVFIEEQLELVSTWYHLLVRELTFLRDFEYSPEYVVRKLGERITNEEAARSLDLLAKQGLIAKSEHGVWYSTDKVLDTGDEVFTRAVMQRHHSETLKTWSESLAILNPDEQELGLLHIPIASEKIPELRKRIRDFQDELIGWLVEEKEADRLVQVGTYLIPFDR